MSSDRLRHENERLRQQNTRLLAALRDIRSKLTEPEEIIRAIRQGEIDALVVEEKGQERIYSLQAFDSVYRSMVEECFPYGVWLAEPDGELLYVSPSFLELLNTDLQEMREKGQFHFLPPGVREAVERQWAKSRETGEVCNVEYNVRFDDGSERTVWTHGVLARTLSGQLHWVGVNIDVTERNKIKNELRQRTEALQERTAELERANEVLQQKIVQHQQAEAAVKIQNLRFRLLAEAAAMLLVTDSPDTMLHRLFTQIRPHLGLDIYFNHMVDDSGDALRLVSCAGISEETARSMARLESGQAPCGVASHRQPIMASPVQHADDSKAEVVKSLGLRAYACNPLLAGDRLLGTLAFAGRSREPFDADEQEFLRTICHYVAVAHERMGLVNKLREADRRKDEFLAMLGHELRNPLAPIKNAVNVMKALDSSDSRHKMAQEIIGRQVAHLTRLVDDLLDVSRIVQGKITLKKAPLDLATVLDHGLEASQPLIQARKHKLTVSIPDRPIRLEGDGVRLAQVVSNLLNNAAKYTPEGGRIWLSASLENGQALIRVKDAGEGISRHLLDQVFDLFVQADGSLDRTQGGLGLGLTIVKHIVEMHGGRIEARSAGAGKGSEFLVWLPVRDK
jgi:PAS domain S-box-containing protein